MIKQFCERQNLINYFRKLFSENFESELCFSSKQIASKNQPQQNFTPHFHIASNERYCSSLFCFDHVYGFWHFHITGMYPGWIRFLKPWQHFELVRCYDQEMMVFTKLYQVKVTSNKKLVMLFIQELISVLLEHPVHLDG